MKTKNNVQKAITKTLAAGMSLVLISITVNAQDFWRSLYENSSFNTIATAMVDKNPTAANSETRISSAANFSTFEIEAEEALPLENWMTNESYFEAGFSVETETEAPLLLENWMTNDNAFDVHLFDAVEAEESLELEDWMLNENYFESPAFEIMEETEKPLEPACPAGRLENWMLEEHNFNTNEAKEQPLELESWMISDKIWVG